MKSPLVSILLPVFNAEAYVGESIQSLLAQTFTDFELIILDDGSTDQSVAIIQTFTDPRIRFFQQPTNQGLIATLNSALDYARGQYIARQDADDLSLPERLAKQVAFMEQNPAIGLCSSWIGFFDVNPIDYALYAPPTSKEAIRAHLLWHCPVVHGAMMMRSHLLTSGRCVYEAAFPHAEDYRLFAQIAQNEALVNLPEVLLMVRQHPAKVSQRFRVLQQQSTVAVQRSLLLQLGLKPTEAQMALHFQLYSGHLPQDKATLQAVAEWLGLVYEAARRANYDLPALADVMRQMWGKLAAGQVGLNVLKLEKTLPFLQQKPWWHWPQLKRWARHWMG